MSKLSLSAFFAVLISTISFPSFSQENTLLLKSGTFTIEFESDLSWTSEELIDNRFYRIIVFNNIPSSEAKVKLAEAGIELMDYLPRNSFFASISNSVNWTALENAIVLPIENDYKLSRLLSVKEYPHWTLFGENQIELVASYFEEVAYANVEKQVLSIGGQVVSTNASQQTMNIRLNLSDLDTLYALNGFYYYEVLQSESMPENESGRTNHRSNTLWTEYSGGLAYNGAGITIMMQDDGIIGPHIDYTGRIDQSNCAGCSTAAGNTHGDHVSGTITGAGNLNPAYRGMAHGADLLVYGSNNNNYNGVPNLYDNDGLTITSKSYSNGCNDGYTSLARQLDEQIFDRPSLIHVFSAGNNGGSACSPNNYGAGATWGNITGGHKMGKNLLTVGNLTSTDVLAGSSSRGPATDGRIKPDICAVGSSVTSTGPDNIYFTISGTSMSCPGIAGTIAQLYEGYKDLNGGSNPDAALIKASVLNTAEDLGNEGPDFRFGWGRINARQAFDLISNNQYMAGSIAQGGNHNHQVSVPVGVSELRIMVYWTDVEGSTNANPALVNDINMVVTDPGTTTYNPWVLDHTPANVNLTAVRAIDNLNNVEQVTIIDPAAGTYDIDLNGFAIPQGAQDYYVVYYFVRDEITVTHPIGAEGIQTAAGSLVRWDAPEGTTDFTIEYTTNDGATWNTAGTAPANRRYYAWTTPNIVSGLARVRVSRGVISDESDAVFAFIDVPNNLEFAWACPDSSNLSWDAVVGATSYEVSMLGSKYMDSIGTTAATNFTVPIGSTINGWFSVRALGPNNARGERAIAIEKGLGEFNCAWSPPIAAFDIDCPSAGTGHCFDLTNQSSNAIPGTTYAWYFPGGTPATSTDPSPIVCYATPGQYDVAMVVNNGIGIDSIYSANAVYVANTPGLPYFEGFENYTNFFNIDEWSTFNPDGNQSFLINSNASLSGTKSASLYNYSQNGNFEDELISGPVDLSTLASTDDITLTFRYSYRKKVAANDEWLKVFITKSCEDAWVQRKTIHGDALSPLTSSIAWAPSTDADWTTVHMTNITDAYFVGDFRCKFEFESDGGNNIYLDNINLYQGAPSNDIVSGVGLSEMELSNASLYPNPTDGELNVEFDLNNAQATELTILDLTGKQLESYSVSGQSGKNSAFIDLNTLTSGVYFLKIHVEDASHQMRFIIQ